MKTLAQTEVLKLERLAEPGGNEVSASAKECYPASEARILAHATDGQCK